MTLLHSQAGNNRLSSENVALLLIDHQTGLMQLVRDYEPDEFKNNILALADIGLAFNLPTILTSSFEEGPNGPLLPELKEKFPRAPFIPRPGQINAWDNEDFVKAVKKTGRKKLLIAGILTDVCVAFPAISALAEGYEVYVVVDASGTVSRSVREAALSRIFNLGAIPINWIALGSELQRDWRNNGDKLAKVFKEHFVPYANLISSHEARK